MFHPLERTIKKEVLLINTKTGKVNLGESHKNTCFSNNYIMNFLAYRWVSGIVLTPPQKSISNLW